MPSHTHVRHLVPRLLVLAAVALVAPRSARAEPARILKAATGHLFTEAGPWGEELLDYKADLAARTNGAFVVDPHFDGALGDESRLIQALQLGRIQLGLISTAALAAAMPDLQVLELPFAFADREQAAKLLDERLFDSVRVVLEVQGLVLQRWEELGWEGVGSRDGFVTSPAALRSLTLHTQEAPVYFMTWSYAGATVKQSQHDAVARYLQAGSVKAFANVPLLALAGGWHEHVTHYTVSHHRYRSAAWVLSKAFVDRLTPDLKEKLLAGRSARFEASRKRVREHEARALEAFAAKGVQLHTLTTTERESFGALAERIKQRLLQRASPTAQSFVKAVNEATGR